MPRLVSTACKRGSAEQQTDNDPPEAVTRALYEQLSLHKLHVQKVNALETDSCTAAQSSSRHDQDSVTVTVRLQWMKL